MSRRGLAAGAVLALSIWALSTAGTASADADDDKAIKESQQDVVALAKDIEAGKDAKAIAKKAAAIQKKYEDLNHVMQIYKPTPKKGLGVLPRGKGDGIELKIGSLSKRAAKAQIAKQQKELIFKLGYVNLAMAEVTRLYPPPKKPGKGAKEWKQYSDDMKKAAKELISALQKNNPAAVKKAATKLDDSCTLCHKDFRDAGG
jgi:hypothetical protein